VRVTSAELSAPIGSGDYNLSSTWGYTFEWTLRQGEQLLVQHKYMEFRYVTLQFLPPLAPSSEQRGSDEDGDGTTDGGTDDGSNTDGSSTGVVQVPTDFGLSAWKVEADYVASDSHFDSDNDILNKVWEVSIWDNKVWEVGI
jgi:hypothetical protein